MQDGVICNVIKCDIRLDGAVFKIKYSVYDTVFNQGRDRGDVLRRYDE